MPYNIQSCQGGVMLINRKLTKCCHQTAIPATIVCPYITLVLVIKKSHMLFLVVQNFIKMRSYRTIHMINLELSRLLVNVKTHQNTFCVIESMVYIIITNRIQLCFFPFDVCQHQICFYESTASGTILLGLCPGPTGGLTAAPRFRTFLSVHFHSGYAFS